MALLLGLAAALAFFLTGCGDDNGGIKYNYLRSASPPTVDTAKADTLCDDPGPNFRADGFDPAATCRQTRKYVLQWESPEDTGGFRGYRIFIDTTPKNRTWRAARGDDKEAALFIKGSASTRGFVFFFFDGNNPPDGIRKVPNLPDTLSAGERRIIGIDTTGRVDEKLNAFIIALVTRYSGSGTQGEPQYARIVIGDKSPPYPFKPAIVPGPRGLTVDWERPFDPTSFFNPGMDTGIIAAYYLTVRLAGKILPDQSARFAPVVKYFAGGKEKEGVTLDSIISGPDGPIARRFRLPDGERAHHGLRGPADSLRVVVSGLFPRDNLDISLYAEDSAGNNNRASVPNATGLYLTDTTQPLKPVLSVIDSLTSKNSFTIRWVASRDLYDPAGNGSLQPGPDPNFRILEYRLSRTLVRPSGEKPDPFDRKDTVIVVTKDNAGDSVMVDSARFLPPGKTYRITLQAVDTSRFLSEVDTAFVTTDSVSFTGADSGFTCPAGLVPIPTAKFQLGDTARAGSDLDEKPARQVRVESFCIEPFEHRDSSGAFMTKVTWEQADSVCRALSPTDSSMLCSEVEWERACEGYDVDRPHLHGIQSERAPDILQTSCNQATGDSVMAMSFAKRNPICLTNEGVYDMAGNLSEWVRDNYNPKAYDGLKDTVVGHGFTFPAAGSGDSLTVHGFRGGNFVLPPKATTAANQAMARCSNRDLPMPLRPIFRPECADSVPKIAVLYGEGLANHRCFPIPDSLRGNSYSDIVSDKDSTKVLLFHAGSTRRDVISIPVDTAFRGKKPTEVRFTTLSLAEVAFERVGKPSDVVVDTLDASEMKDTAQAKLAVILARESPSSAWKPRMENGRFAVKRFYGYAVIRSKVAKINHASRSAGFRCCSRPRPK